MELDFLAGLIAGLAASVHCLAMCGGVAAAVAVNAGAARGAAGKTWVLIQAQLARVAVYIALGIAAGAVGWGFHGDPDAGAAHAVLRWLAALTLVIAAYAVAEIPLFGGAAGHFAAKLASPVYRRLHHLHRFGPAGLGAAWGLMPCAMVYIATFYAGVSGGPLQGALIMAGFGLGTIPALTADRRVERLAERGGALALLVLRSDGAGGADRLRLSARTRLIRRVFGLMMSTGHVIMAASR